MDPDDPVALAYRDVMIVINALYRDDHIDKHQWRELQDRMGVLGQAIGIPPSRRKS